ncbi:hypothetical protein MLD38_025361 [Melastoma candidum]|uniref:Uncharacterized protein n=1 Tax=Melastoma candidum TaxID=119954 RepID=A0ACB9P221_9MYRT|nr:hypothetical protein MLD38_025361 [Melastoma candidum]
MVSCIERRSKQGFSGLTLNCLRLGDQAVKYFLRPHLQELHLLKGSLLTPQVIAFISDNCPDLRVLTVEFTDDDPHFTIAKNKSLSLILNVISDVLVAKLTSYLPQLLVLELEDIQTCFHVLFSDLTDSGLQ